MAISGVETKCYILSLFIRDDGERFVLGNGYYEFKDNQLHFQTNTIANDIVEVQGNDGYLLAGQVRRPGTQSFDGYIADGTVSKTETEAKRRAFFAFFRKNYFYKVIYVFPDGSAIQRKRGFLVDDPTVQELYQQYPEYHVALNFEDVNYYSYSEDDQGGEIFAKEAMIYLSAGATSGGLVWDNIGVEWDEVDGDLSRLVTVSGKSLSINNTNNYDTPITGLKLKGDSHQAQYAGYQLLTGDGFATPVSDTSYWATNNGVVNSDLGNGWSHWEISSSDSYLNYFTRMAAAIGGGSYEPNTVYTIKIEWENAVNIKGFNVNQVVQGTSPFVDELNVSGSEMPYGSKVFVTTTKSSITNIMYGLRLFSGRSNTSIPSSIDLRVTIAKGDLSSSIGWEPYTGSEGDAEPAPNPDYPQEIDIVTGQQTIIVNADGQSQMYPVDLGDIELCKIGNYQDYIYKNSGNWYVHKEVFKSELWELSPYWKVASEGDTTNGISFYVGSGDVPLHYRNIGISNCFKRQDYSSDHTLINFIMFGASTIVVNIGIDKLSSADKTGFVEWLEDNSAVAYFPLATPTNTQITDSTIISQLEAISALELVPGQNDIATSSADLSSEIEFSYRVSVEATGGAIWESGGGGGPTTVEVDSIDNVYPIWTVSGPAVNPQLSVLSTNTTINYAGTVTASQTLVIDMFNKTATLNGTSVIGNVYGEWVNFAPGNNRVVYTTNNADASPSIIQWQEVVG